MIENHPGTISTGPGVGKYDDTDFLSRMFTENPAMKDSRQIEPLGLNRQDSSSEVLHKSQSVKMLGEVGATSSATPTAGQTSIAARMLARKNNIIQLSQVTNSDNKQY